jgi:poly[(R)-3-hydroxyalkanoate] polymerase subunit PhaC
MVNTLGNIPADFLNLEFLMLEPFELGVQKYIDLLDNIDCESKRKDSGQKKLQWQKRVK